MVAVAMREPVNSYVVETEFYRCVIDLQESVISVETELSGDMARKIAQFEAERVNVSISLIFGLDSMGTKKTYLFRLKNPGCLDDAGEKDAGDRYKDFTGRHTPGCEHSKRGTPQTCSMCIAAAEKAELIRKIKAGEL